MHWLRLNSLALPVVILALIILPFLWLGALVEFSVVNWAERAEDWALFSGVVGLLALDVLLPVPSSILSFAAGGSLGAWTGGLAVWLGMTFGAGLGAAFGKGILGPVERSLIGKAPTPVSEISWVGLVLFRPVPVLAEYSVLMAAARGVGLWPLIAVTSLANVPIAAFYGYFGSIWLNEAPLWALLLCLAVLAGTILVWQRMRKA